LPLSTDQLALPRLLGACVGEQAVEDVEQCLLVGVGEVFEVAEALYQGAV
jgi:hypothetical protein